MQIFFRTTTVIAVLKYASFVCGDMTTNYNRISSKFSRTGKVVIDREFILLHRSIFDVDLNWINFSRRASPKMACKSRLCLRGDTFFMPQLYDSAWFSLGKV